MSTTPNYFAMTNEELEKVCAEVGIPYNKPSTVALRKELISQIKASKGELVTDAETSKGVFDKKDFVCVEFHNKDENDLPYVFIGLNGKSWYIPKEREVLIPRYLLKVVNDAVEVKFIQKEDRNGKPYLEERRVHRFPYTVVNRPTA